jgi:hypothetical protein
VIRRRLANSPVADNRVTFRLYEVWGETDPAQLVDDDIEKLSSDGGGVSRGRHSASNSTQPVGSAARDMEKVNRIDTSPGTGTKKPKRPRTRGHTRRGPYISCGRITTTSSILLFSPPNDASSPLVSSTRASERADWLRAPQPDARDANHQ